MAEDPQFGPYVDSAASEPVYINGYLIGGEFANGRFATVYLGTRNHENFAMKALQLNQKTTNENHQNEVAIMSSLKHANVVTYEESFTDVTLFHLGGAKLYIVMEYCELGTLSSILNLGNRKGVNKRFIAMVMAMICCGMKHIHSKRVIHRDIKPDNIFIKEDGVVKIGDFGGSAFLEPDTLTTGRFGSDVYMSPECKQGQYYGFPSDMWSIGQVFHDLCFLGQLMDSDVLTPLKDRLKSREPSSRPTAAEAHLLFREIEQNLRQGNPVGAFAGNNGAGPAVGVNETVSIIIKSWDNYISTH